MVRKVKSIQIIIFFSCFETVYNFLLYIRSLILFHDALLYRNFIFCLLYSISSDLKNVFFLPQARLPLVGIDFEPTVVYNSGAKARDTFFAQWDNGVSEQ